MNTLTQHTSKRMKRSREVSSTHKQSTCERGWMGGGGGGEEPQRAEHVLCDYVTPQCVTALTILVTKYQLSHYTSSHL